MSVINRQTGFTAAISDYGYDMTFEQHFEKAAVVDVCKKILHMYEHKTAVVELKAAVEIRAPSSLAW